MSTLLHCFPSFKKIFKLFFKFNFLCVLLLFQNQNVGVAQPMLSGFCGYDGIRSLIKSQNSTFEKTEKDINLFIKNNINSYKNNQETGKKISNSYIIPVVVHLVYKDTDLPGTGSNISYSQVLSQITGLNAAFSKNYPSYNGQSHATYATNTDIQFCLAKTVAGVAGWSSLAEPGVMRYPIASGYVDGPVYNTSLNPSDGLKLVHLTHGNPVNQSVFPFENYLNIWVVNSINTITPSVIGFATFPQYNSYPLDGIVIRADAFGDNTVTGNNFPLMAQLDQGKILAHEAGHYLNLYHIFEGGCSGMNASGSVNDPCDLNGDNICDIAPCTTQNISCSSPILNTCSENYSTNTTANDMIDSYMSYADDNCMNTFTNDQKLRMQATLQLLRSNLCSPLNLAYTGVIGPNSCLPPQPYTNIFLSNTILCYPGNNTVTFSNPTGPFNTAVSWNWSFTGGTPSVSTFSSQSVAYNSPGVYTAILTITDNLLQTFTDSLLVTVNSCALDSNRLNQANWYFGNNLALSFNSGIPIEVHPSMIHSFETCATESDSVGNLLFYTDGNFVWNKNHQVMAGLGGILTSHTDTLSVGNTSSMQGTIIIPDPGNKTTGGNRYYIFRTLEQENAGGGPIKFAIVDMNLNAGLGDLAAVNLSIPAGLAAPNTMEAISAVPHCNGIDYWVICHGSSTGYYNKLISYLLTGNGISKAIISNSQFTNSMNGGRAGHIKASFNGELIAVAGPVYQDTMVHIYSFNASSGSLISVSSINVYSGSVPAFSFAPHRNYLYILSMNFGLLKQVDLSIPTNPVVFNTPLNIISGLNFMETGPDGRIYFSSNYHKEISVINSPDSLNTLSFPNACGAVMNGGPIMSSNLAVQAGLPNMIDAFEDQLTPGFTVTMQSCSTATFSFNNVCWENYLATWNFNDGSPTDTGVTITHTFTQTGLFQVSLTLSIDTFYMNPMLYDINILSTQVAIQGPTNVCLNLIPSPLYKVPYLQGATYSWTVTGGQAFANGNTCYVVWNTIGNGTISVQVNYNNCSANTTINVLVNQLVTPVIFPGGPLSICNQDSVLLTVAADTGLVYVWSLNGNPIVGEDSSAIFVSDSGSYIITVINGGGCAVSSLPVTVSFNGFATNAGIDYTFCGSKEVALGGNPTVSGNSGPYSYEWTETLTGFQSILENPIFTAPQNNSSVPVIYSVFLTASNMAGCKNTEEVLITVNPTTAIYISSSDTVLTCERTSVSMFAIPENASFYEWFLNGNLLPNANNHDFQTSQSGLFNVELINSYGCKSSSGQIQISKQNKKMNISPNPANNFIYFQISLVKNEQGLLVLYNSLSQKILEIELPFCYNEFTMPTAGMAGGIYFYTIISSDEIVTKGKLVLLK